MDQILAFDGSVGILEYLHRTVSIIRVMRKIRWQRATDSRRKHQHRNVLWGRNDTRSKGVFKESSAGVGHQLRLSKHTGAVPWLSHESPEVPAHLQIPGSHLDSGWNVPSQRQSCLVWFLLGTFQGRVAGVGSLPLWLLQPGSGWPFPL